MIFSRRTHHISPISTLVTLLYKVTKVVGGTKSQFRAAIVVTLVLNREFVPNHFCHPVHKGLNDGQQQRRQLLLDLLRALRGAADRAVQELQGIDEVRPRKMHRNVHQNIEKPALPDLQLPGRQFNSMKITLGNFLGPFWVYSWAIFEAGSIPLVSFSI